MTNDALNHLEVSSAIVTFENVVRREQRSERLRRKAEVRVGHNEESREEKRRRVGLWMC